LKENVYLYGLIYFTEYFFEYKKQVSYSLNRKDYNVDTGTSTPGTGASVYRDVVGSDVRISIALEVNRNTY